MPRAIVITGASGGIGAALARQLGARGDRVVLAARREAELRTLANEIGSHAHAEVADLYLADVAEALAEVRSSGESGRDVRARYA